MKYSVSILFLLFSLSLFAQKDEVSIQWRSNNSSLDIRTVSKKKRTGGAYWGLNAHYGQIAGEDAFILGTTLAYVANRSLEIGVSAQGIYSSNSNIGFYDNDVIVGGAYGGLHLAPVLFSNKAIHFTFPVLIGGGVAGYYDYKTYEELDIEDYDWDVMFVIEPGANVEFNITRFMRIGAGVKYRFTNQLDIVALDNNDFRGWSGGLSLKFGKF